MVVPRLLAFGYTSYFIQALTTELNIKVTCTISQQTAAHGIKARIWLVMWRSAQTASEQGLIGVCRPRCRRPVAWTSMQNLANI